MKKDDGGKAMPRCKWVTRITRSSPSGAGVACSKVERHLQTTRGGRSPSRSSSTRSSSVMVEGSQWRDEESSSSSALAATASPESVGIFSLGKSLIMGSASNASVAVPEEDAPPTQIPPPSPSSQPWLPLPHPPPPPNTPPRKLWFAPWFCVWEWGRCARVRRERERERESSIERKKINREMKQ